MSAEEQIRKHAKTVWELECENCIWKEHTLEDPNPDVQWVPFDVVLGVVAKSEAENEEIRVALAKTCIEFSQEIGKLERAEVERSQKLQALLNEMPSYDKDFDDVGGMYPIEVQMFGTKLDEWKRKLEAFLSAGSFAKESAREKEAATPQ